MAIGEYVMKALIVGSDGQDGYYLSKYLRGIGYEVYGVVRKKTVGHQDTDLNSAQKYHQIYADLTDFSSLINAVGEACPDEIYNLAGQSEIPLSWRQPSLTAEVNALGVIRLLETIRLVNPSIRFFQASSSEMFGGSSSQALNEKSLFQPRNPYGTSKVFAHWCVDNYRTKYGLFACCGILFNHESPRRGQEFVTRKISMAAAKIHLGKQDYLSLGNLGAIRDWGHAADYVRGMHLLLQQDAPQDYVIATGIPHSVRDFAAAAFRAVGREIVWQNCGLDEAGFDARTGEQLVCVDPALFRFPAEDCIMGDSSKIRRELNFHCQYTFEQLVREMVERDVALLMQTVE